MRKTLSLMLAVVLMSTVSFAQYYASKQDAKNGKLSLFTESPQNSSNKAVNATFFSEDFEGDLSAWSNFDEDGDGNQWDLIAAPNGHDDSQCAYSASWISGVGAVTPDNWLTSGAIDLSAAGASTLLDFWRKGLDQTWAGEVFSVYISTSGNTVADFTGANGTVLIDQETVIADDWQKRSISLAPYTGGTVYIAFRHHNITDMFYLVIDDIEVYENATVDGGITGFVSPNNNSSCALTATEDVTITIFNYGGAALTGFDASYSINGGAAVTETVTASIPAASSIDYTFTQTADLSTLGYYDITASLTVASDIDATNDNAATYVANGDASMTIDVSSDSQSGQAWYVINMVTGDTIASHGAYQWDLVNDITTVCLNNADCYKFSWVGGTSNDVVVSHEGNQIDSRTATGDYQLFGIGNGCAADDVNMNSVTVPSTVGLGNVDITGSVINTGTNALTSFDVVYSIDGGAASATFNATCNIATGETFDFTHNVPWSSVLGSHNINITVSNANGAASADNSMDQDIIVINEVFPKTVVYEEGTGTWCGWCVRGLVGLNTMANDITDGSWIGIGVHNGDPMAVTDYDNAIGAFITGYPSGVMNRYAIAVDPGLASLQAYYAAHMQVAPVAKIEITDQTWNTGSRDFTVEVTTTFGVDMASADYNAALIVVEDGVTGTGAGWEQANYYSGGGSGPMTDYDGTDYTALADPVPAADMTYNHVGRQLVSGWGGAAGSIPTSVTYNVGNTYTFNGNIPAGQDENNIHYVAIIIDNASQQIINATSLDLDITSAIKRANNANFNIFPNPTTGLVKVEGVEGAQVVVYNMIGEVVYTEANASATTTIDLSSYNAGNYIVKVINNNEVSTQKIVLTK